VDRSVRGPRGISFALVSSTQPSERLLSVTTALRRVLRRRVRDAFGDHGLPGGQAELLNLVAQQPGASVGEVAAELRLAPNTVSATVTRLVDGGLLARERDPLDGRGVRLEVTDAGRERVRQRQSRRMELVGSALDGLAAADRAAIAAALPALERLVDAISEDLR
jgi:DNA-binding MarR family transcriptional regulator